LATLDGLAPDDFLGQLAALRSTRDQFDRDIREYLAYAREFTRPRPYTLAELAEAAGMSISGVRTAYTPADLDAVARALGRAPRRQ
jgi:AraC-like DNA-binding protein